MINYVMGSCICQEISLLLELAQCEVTTVKFFGVMKRVCMFVTLFALFSYCNENVENLRNEIRRGENSKGGNGKNDQNQKFRLYQMHKY